MVYTPLNEGLPNKRETSISKRLRQQRLDQGNRYEYQKSMYGNVHTIIDHKRKYYYRQDMPIKEQLDLLDEPLPRYCDYCKSDCQRITLIEYELVYEMVIRPMIDPEIKRDSQKVKYASCDDCLPNARGFIPDQLKSGYVVEIWQDKELIWKSGLLVCDGKIRRPFGAI